MAEVLLAEYGRAKTINFDLYEVDGVDFRVDAADGGSDCSIMKDEGAEGTCTNDFVDEGQSYSLALTATEMQAARVTILVVDSATKVYLDKHIYIETYGHPSSQHPNMTPYWTNGAVNDVSASSSAWTFDGFTEATADHVIGGLLTFTSGANKGQCRPVSDFTSTVITVNPAFLAAPADNDEFVIAPRPAASALDWVNGERLDLLLDAIPTTAMRGTDSAALASVATEARLAELDAGNLPTDIAAIPTTAMRGTDNVVLAGPTKAEMDAAHALLATEANIGVAGAGLTDLGGMSTGMKGEIESEVNDALVALHLDHLVIAQGTVETSGSNSITQVQTTLTEASNDHYKHGTILFLDNAEAGQYRTIITYTGATGIIAWDRALTGIPADGTEFILLPVGADAGAVWDEILTAAEHNIATSAGRRVRQAEEFQGYEGGAIHIDTVNGSAGAVDYTNGTIENPVNNMGDALTLAASLGYFRFQIANGSAIVLGATVNNYIFEGFHWTLDLSDEDIADSVFIGAEVTGVGTGTGTQLFLDGFMGAATLPANTHIHGAALTGKQTLGTGSRFFDNCHSGIAGTGTITFDFQVGIGNTDLNIRHHSGGIELQNMGDTGVDQASIEGWGQYILNANCDGGTLVIRGNFEKTDNSGNVTIIETARIDTLQINTEADLALSDYAGPTKAEMDAAHALLATPAQVKTQVDAGFTTQMADSMVADGTIPTREQALLFINRFFQEFIYSGTTLTIFKEDGTTAIATFTLDDETNPTGATRAT